MDLLGARHGVGRRSERKKTKMKKLMIAAAIVCAAALAQASSIKWSHLEDYNAYNADGTMITSEPDSYNLVLALLGTTGDWSYENATQVASSSWDIGSEGGESWAAASGTYSSSNIANGQVYAVMVKDADGKLSQLTYLDGTENDITFTVSGLSDNRYSGSFKFATADYVVGETGSAIPEPTSALMLLVGLAGLALKRKVA